MRGDDVMSADGDGWEPSRILYPGCTAGMFLTEASRRTEGFYRDLLTAALTGEEPGLEQLAQALTLLPEGASPRLLLLKTHLRQLCRLGAEIGDHLEEHGLGGASGYLEPDPATLLVNEVLHHHFGETTLESLEMVPEEAPHTDEELAILELDHSLPEGMAFPASLRHADQEETPHDDAAPMEGPDVSRSTPSGASVPEKALRPRQEALLDAARHQEAFDAPQERTERARLRSGIPESQRSGASRTQRSAPPPWLEALPDTGADPWLNSNPIEQPSGVELTAVAPERPGARLSRFGPAQGSSSSSAQGSSVSPAEGLSNELSASAQTPLPPKRVSPPPPPVPTATLSDAESHALWQALGPQEEEDSLTMFPSLPAPPPRQRTPKRSVDDAAATWEHAAEPLPAQWQKSMEELAFEPQPGDQPPLPPDPADPPGAAPSGEDSGRPTRRAQEAALAGPPTRRVLPLGARPQPTAAAASDQADAPADPGASSSTPLASDVRQAASASIPTSMPTSMPTSTPAPVVSQPVSTSLGRAARDASARTAPSAEDTLEIPDVSADVSTPFGSPPVERPGHEEDAVSLPLRAGDAEASTSLPYPEISASATWQRSSLDWESGSREGSSSAPEASVSGAAGVRSTAQAGAVKPHSAMDVFQLSSDETVLAQASDALAPTPHLTDALEPPVVTGSPGLPPHPAEADLPPQPPSTALTVLEQLASASQTDLPDLLWDASSLLAEAPDDDISAHSLLRILTRLSKSEQSVEQLRIDQQRTQDTVAQKARTDLEAQLAAAQAEAKDVQTRLQTAEAKLARLGKQDAERVTLESSLEQQLQTLDRTDTLLDQLFYADLIDWSALGEDAFPARGRLAEKFSRLGETLESWRSMAELHTGQQEALKAELDAMKELLSDKEHLILNQDRMLAEQDEQAQALQARIKRQTGETARFKVLALWQNARVQMLELRRKIEAAMSAKSLFGRRKMPEPPQMRELVMAMDHVEEVLERLQGRMDPSDFKVADADLEYLRKFTGAFRRYLEKSGTPVVRPAPAPKRAAPRRADGHAGALSLPSASAAEEVVVPEPKAIDMTSESFASSVSESLALGEGASPESEQAASDGAGDPPSALGQTGQGLTKSGQTEADLAESGP